MNEPPITTVMEFTERADIEPTADGFAIIQDGIRVELSDTLANRFTINVFGARRRASA